jgi:hypothetical protein
VLSFGEPSLRCVRQERRSVGRLAESLNRKARRSAAGETNDSSRSANMPATWQPGGMTTRLDSSGLRLTHAFLRDLKHPAQEVFQYSSSPE